MGESEIISFDFHISQGANDCEGSQITFWQTRHGEDNGSRAAAAEYDFRYFVVSMRRRRTLIHG